jgi:hypothetical protein
MGGIGPESVDTHKINTKEQNDKDHGEILSFHCVLYVRISYSKLCMLTSLL